MIRAPPSEGALGVVRVPPFKSSVEPAVTVSVPPTVLAEFAPKVKVVALFTLRLPKPVRAVF